MQNQFDLSVRELPSVHIVALKGELDIATGERLPIRCLFQPLLDREGLCCICVMSLRPVTVVNLVIGPLTMQHSAGGELIPTPSCQFG